MAQLRRFARTASHVVNQRARQATVGCKAFAASSYYRKCRNSIIERSPVIINGARYTESAIVVQYRYSCKIALMRAIQSSDDHCCFTVINFAVTLHASTYLLDYFRWFWLHKGAYTFQAKQCSHQMDQNDEDCTEKQFGKAGDGGSRRFGRWPWASGEAWRRVGLSICLLFMIGASAVT